jgi:hypothetical protein
MLHKNFFSLLLFLMMTTSCWSQDTIFMRNDQRIPCKIFEVSPTEVKYKKLELSEGPFYIENKSSIARIKYSNGFIDILSEVQSLPGAKEIKGSESYTGQKQYPDLNTIKGEPNLYLSDRRVIRENELQARLLSFNNPKLTEEVRRAKLSKGLSNIGILAIPFGVTGIICAMNGYGGLGGLSPFNDTGKNYKALTALWFGAAALSISATVYFDHKDSKANARAIHLYRQSYLNE